MKNKKTVHAVVKYFYPVAAGIETNMLETYSVFVEKGWEVVVHTTTDTLTESAVLPPTDSIKGIKVQRYPWSFFGFTPDIPWDTATVVALHNFNVFPHMQILISIFLKKLKGERVPVILLTPHGGFTPDWEIFSPVTEWVKKIYHFTVGTWLINRSVDIFRTVSDWEKEEVIKHGIRKEKVIAITNGLEDEAFMDIDKKASKEIKQQVKKFGTYMIQIGRIYNIKNYETVLRALATIPEKINYVIVGPVGDEQYKQFLLDLIKELHLEKRVFFAGVIRGIDKYYLIKHSECMIHMARWESFCNAVHEGMSQGKVCIVSDSYALPYLVKDGVSGYCLKYNDVEAVAEKIRFVLNKKNAGVVEKISKNNTEITQHQSWRDVSIQIQRVLNRKI